MRKKLENFENRFKVFDWQTIGLIFIFTVFLIPTLTSFFLYLINNLETGKYSFKENKIFFSFQFGVNLSSVLIGFLIIYFLENKNEKIFSKKKFSIPYMYYYCYLFVFLASMPIMSILSAIPIFKEDKKLLDQIFNSLSELIYIVVLWVIVIATLLNFKNIFFEIVNWFKTANWKRYLFIICGILAIFIINIICNELISKQPSDNQDSLNPFKEEGTLVQKIINFILLFFLSVVIAPFAEELFTRYFFCYFCSNKLLGLVFGCLYFAFMHVNATGDFEHVLPYLMTSIFLTTMFFVFDGELAYTWIVHMLSNFITLIFMLIEVLW